MAAMYILDTDHLSLIGRATSHPAQRLKFRLAALAPAERITTIITFEEQIRGWMALLAAARTVAKQLDAYTRLSETLERFSTITVLRFDETAALHFEQLKRERLRIGTMDLKIAAIALANDATLLTCNRQDFAQVPGLRIEDWTL